MLKPAQTYENDGADWMKNYDKAVNRKVEILIGNITIYQLTVYVPEVGVKMNFNRIGGKYLNLIDTDAICTKVPEAPETRHLTLDLTERRPARDVSQQRNIAEESLIRFIKTNICPHSNKSNFKIPSFNSGDPYVFVLEQSEDEKWVHKIQFQYSFETGEYAPTSSSAFGRPDEIKDIEGLIKKDILLEIDCGHRGMYR